MYIFKFKKKWFWKSIKVIGHNLQPELNRMDLFLEDGGVYSIGEWSKYDLRLGTDWVAHTKKQMEAESGQDIKLNV